MRHKMMLEKERNKIYIEKHRKNTFIMYFFTVVSVIIMIIICFLIFTHDFTQRISIGNFVINIDPGLLNYFLQNNFMKAVLSICVISIFMIFIINNLFYGDCDYYIDIVARKVYYINGRWKFKREIIVEFENIKNIVLIENMERGESGNIYSYQIDIYDNELNAYKIYVLHNYDMANNIANRIGKIIGVEVIDWSHVENYEGYRKRIL